MAADITRVVGPPGCGKTHRAAQLVAEAADRYGPHTILVCSLTVAAAKTITARVALPDGRVGTLHSHAYRAIGAPPMFDTKPRRQAWADFTTAQGHPEFAFPHDSLSRAQGSEYLEALSLHRMRLDPTPTHLTTFAHLWQTWKQEADCIDFADQIDLALQREARPQPNPSVIVVDEAQDLSRLEYALLRLWATSAHRLILVGDPHQAIFTFRGADADAFYADEGTTEILSQSFRVPHAAHHVAIQLQHKSTLPHVTYSPTTNPGSTTIATGIRLNYALITPLTNRLNQSLTVMALASCDYMLTPLLRALRTARIPFHNPYRPDNLAWNPLAGAGPLRAFLAPDGSAFTHPRGWTLADLKSFTTPMQAKLALLPGAKARLDKIPPSDSLRLLTVDDLLTFLPESTLAHLLAYDIAWWQSTFTPAALSRPSLNLAIETTLAHRTCLDTPPNLIVGTIHSVKGGEADSVFVSPEISPEALTSPYEDLVRLFYVAVTRTRHELVLLDSSPKAPRAPFW